MQEENLSFQFQNHALSIKLQGKKMVRKAILEVQNENS